MKFSIKKVATALGAGATMSLLMAQSIVAKAAFDIGNINPIAPREDVSLGSAIQSFVNIFLWVIGLLAVVYLVYGGVLYITAGGDAEKANKGRTAITNAIIGIVIVVLALAIYNFALGASNTSSSSTLTP